jgi:hypothetical protein
MVDLSERARPARAAFLDARRRRRGDAAQRRGSRQVEASDAVASGGARARGEQLLVLADVEAVDPAHEVRALVAQEGSGSPPSGRATVPVHRQRLVATKQQHFARPHGPSDPAPVRIVFGHIRWPVRNAHGAQDAPAQLDELRCLVRSAHQHSHGEIGAGYGQPFARQHLGVFSGNGAALRCLPKETVREGHDAVTIASNLLC